MFFLVENLLKHIPRPKCKTSGSCLIFRTSTAHRLGQNVTGKMSLRSEHLADRRFCIVVKINDYYVGFHVWLLRLLNSAAKFKRRDLGFTQSELKGDIIASK